MDPHLVTCPSPMCGIATLSSRGDDEGTRMGGNDMDHDLLDLEFEGPTTFRG